MSVRLSDDKMHGYSTEEFKQKYHQHELEMEHRRLKDTVVEAAVKWTKLKSLGYSDSGAIAVWARNDLIRAVVALIAFEAEHQLTPTQKGEEP